MFAAAPRAIIQSRVGPPAHTRPAGTPGSRIGKPAPIATRLPGPTHTGTGACPTQSTPMQHSPFTTPPVRAVMHFSPAALMQVPGLRPLPTAMPLSSGHCPFKGVPSPAARPGLSRGSSRPRAGADAARPLQACGLGDPRRRVHAVAAAGPP